MVMLNRNIECLTYVNWHSLLFRLGASMKQLFDSSAGIIAQIDARI